MNSWTRGTRALEPSDISAGPSALVFASGARLIAVEGRVQILQPQSSVKVNGFR
jgi:hypothetical protein